MLQLCLYTDLKRLRTVCRRAMIGSSDFYQIEFVARFDFCLFDLIKIVLFTFD